MLLINQPNEAIYLRAFRTPWQEKFVYVSMSGFLVATYFLLPSLFWETHQLLLLEIAISPLLAAFTYAVSDEAICRVIRLTLFCLIAVCVFEAIAVFSIMAI